MARRIRLPRLSSDPDARFARGMWTLWLAGFALLAVFLWLDPPRVMLPIVVPLAAALLLHLLARGVSAFLRWMRWRAHAQWHGAYFEFDGRQIRVLFESGDVWIAADDVFDALGLTGRARDAERVRRIAGRDGLVNAPGTTLLAFTERGLAAWMERRADRAAADFKRWFDTQVTAPYRRKRARIGEANIPPAINSTR